MAEKVMFKINTTDYSQRVVGSGYEVQSNDEYETWTDANGKEHRSAYRTRISGKFSMLFKDMSEYTTFATLLAAQKRTDLTYPVTVYDNKTGTETTINAFLDYTLSQYRGPGFDDRMEQIEITIKEQ